jgi:hypothetical protein
MRQFKFDVVNIGDPGLYLWRCCIQMVQHLLTLTLFIIVNDAVNYLWEYLSLLFCLKYH